MTAIAQGFRRAVVLIATVAACTAASAVSPGTASAFSGSYCDQVLLGAGGTCVHGTYHSSYSYIRGESTGTAYTSTSVSDKSSYAHPIYTVAVSQCGGCWAQITACGGGTPGGWVYLHNRSSFTSRFTGWIHNNC